MSKSQCRMKTEIRNLKTHPARTTAYFPIPTSSRRGAQSRKVGLPEAGEIT
jgi:hypothetical protein